MTRPAKWMGTPGAALDRLYPFLTGAVSTDTAVDSGAVLRQVKRSMEDKAREIIELRDRLGREQGERLRDCAVAAARAFEAGGKLLAFGNGGSATDAQAIARLFLHPPSGRPVPALGIASDVATVTALSNDVGFEVAFARQIAAFGRAGDVAVGLSTSGNSANVLRAFDEAAQRGMLTIGFAGYEGGRMAEARSIQHLFVVPSTSVHRIQEAQTTLYHVLWQLTQDILTADTRARRG